MYISLFLEALTYFCPQVGEPTGHHKACVAVWIEGLQLSRQPGGRRLTRRQDSETGVGRRHTGSSCSTTWVGHPSRTHEAV